MAKEKAAIQGNGRWTKRRIAFPCESLQCRNYGLFLSRVKRHSLPLLGDSYLLLTTYYGAIWKTTLRGVRLRWR